MYTRTHTFALCVLLLRADGGNFRTGCVPSASRAFWRQGRAWPAAPGRFFVLARPMPPAAPPRRRLRLSFPPRWCVSSSRCRARTTPPSWRRQSSWCTSRCVFACVCVRVCVCVWLCLVSTIASAAYAHHIKPACQPAQWPARDCCMRRATPSPTRGGRAPPVWPRQPLSMAPRPWNAAHPARR